MVDIVAILFLLSTSILITDILEIMLRICCAQNGSVIITIT
jgi:hypothetical protein